MWLGLRRTSGPLLPITCLALLACLRPQVQLLEDGQAAAIVQETRLWDEGQQCTYSMRKKEGLADYRYFPEPDLPALVLNQAYLDEIQVRWYSGHGWRCALCGQEKGHLLLHLLLPECALVMFSLLPGPLCRPPCRSCRDRCASGTWHWG